MRWAMIALSEAHARNGMTRHAPSPVGPAVRSSAAASGGAREDVTERGGHVLLFLRLPDALCGLPQLVP